MLATALFLRFPVVALKLPLEPELIVREDGTVRAL
jgi:hypothetical protein